MFVEEQGKANYIHLQYPSTTYQISVPRGQILYYIAGYVASRAWTHQRRHKLSPDWERVVLHNTFRSSAEAIARQPMLRDFVAVVDQKNDLRLGPGLLYPTLEWVEFMFALERGYFHFLKDPMYLGAFLGDLPAEILRVVSEAEYVKEKWRQCCPPDIDPSALSEMFPFCVGKFHNVRMGDYVRSASENTSLKLSKAALGLRQKLNAQSAAKGGTKRGAGGGDEEGGADGGARGQGEGGGGGGRGAGTNRRKRARRRQPPTLEELKGMSRQEVRGRCTRKELVVLKNKAGIERGTEHSRKEDLIDDLEQYVGGFRQDSVGGAGPNATGTGPGGAGVGVCGGENESESKASTGVGNVSSGGSDLTSEGVPVEDGGRPDEFLSRPIAMDFRFRLWKCRVCLPSVMLALSKNLGR